MQLSLDAKYMLNTGNSQEKHASNAEEQAGLYC